MAVRLELDAGNFTHRDLEHFRVQEFTALHHALTPCPQNSPMQQTLKSHYHTMNSKYVLASHLLGIQKNEAREAHYGMLR
jgi:hypothetical protein